MVALSAVPQGVERKAPILVESGVKVVTDALRNLLDLHIKAGFAAEAYKDAVKAVADESGYPAPAIRKMLNARIKGNLAEKKRAAEQQLELFTEVGED